MPLTHDDEATTPPQCADECCSDEENALLLLLLLLLLWLLMFDSALPNAASAEGLMAVEEEGMTNSWPEVDDSRLVLLERRPPRRELMNTSSLTLSSSLRFAFT